MSKNLEKINKKQVVRTYMISPNSYKTKIAQVIHFQNKLHKL